MLKEITFHLISNKYQLQRSYLLFHCGLSTNAILWCEILLSGKNKGRKKKNYVKVNNKVQSHEHFMI